MQDSNMRTIGTSAYAGVKHITLDEYEKICSDSRIKATGYSVIVGYAAGDCFHKTPTEVRFADKNYADWTFHTPEQGRLPKTEDEIATSRIVLTVMGLPAEIGTQVELTYMKDTDFRTDTFTLCGI